MFTRLPGNTSRLDCLWRNMEGDLVACSAAIVHNARGTLGPASEYLRGTMYQWARRMMMEGP